MGSGPARRALAAIALLGAAALLLAAAVPAAGASASLAATGGSVDDGLDADVELDADDDLELDANATLEAGDDETGVDTAVDADASTAEGAGVDADGTASTGDGNATVDAEVSADDGTLAAGAEFDHGLALAPNATLRAGAGLQSGPDDGSDGTGDEADGEREESPDDGDADDEEDGGVPVPEDLGTGLAVGSLLAGGGLAGRRVATAAVSGGGQPSTLSVVASWLRAWGWRVAAILGYQRWDGSDPLEHETRAAIAEHLEAEPGACLTELAEAVDVPLSTLRYHLRILAFEDLVASVEVRGKRRVFPADVDPDALAPALEDEATAAVLGALADEPDSVSGLAERLDRDPSTVTHHLQRLEAEGLVERERDGRSVVNRLAEDVAADVAAAAAGPVAGAAD